MGLTLRDKTFYIWHKTTFLNNELNKGVHFQDHFKKPVSLNLDL